MAAGVAQGVWVEIEVGKQQGTGKLAENAVGQRDCRKRVPGRIAEDLKPEFTRKRAWRHETGRRKGRFASHWSHLVHYEARGAQMARGASFPQLKRFLSGFHFSLIEG